MDPVLAYHDLIEAIRSATGASSPMLHVHFGMGIFLLAQLLLGSRRGSLAALFIVLEMELLNEAMNRLFHGSWRWADTMHDIVLTLLWPGACVAVSKIRRWRWHQRERRRKAAQHAPAPLLRA